MNPSNPSGKKGSAIRPVGVVLAGSLAWAGFATGAAAGPATATLPHVSGSALEVMATSPYCRAAGTLDAETVFTLLVARYRRLETYSDQVVVTWRTIDDAFPEAVDEVNMTMDCQATNEELTVQTSGGTFWRSLGVRVPFRATPETSRIADDVEYYLAPHMVLKFSDRPLEQLNAERGRSLEARQVTEVTINDRRLVQLDLKVRSQVSASATSVPSESGVASTVDDTESTMSLFINPDSMLVERVNRREQLDDGRMQTTTLDITPTAHRDTAEAMPEVSTPPNPTPHTLPVSPTAPPATGEPLPGMEPTVPTVPAVPTATDAGAAPPMDGLDESTDDRTESEAGAGAMPPLF
jgi:hypothetical protein